MAIAFTEEIKELARAIAQAAAGAKGYTEKLKAVFNSNGTMLGTLEALSKETKGTTGDLSDLDAAIGRVGSESDDASKKAGFLERKFSEVGKAMGAVGAVMASTRGLYMDYADAARTSARGTALMGISLQDMKGVQDSVTRAAVDLNKTTGLGIEQTVKLASGIAGIIKQTDRPISTEELKEWTESVGMTSKITGASTDDLVKFNQTLAQTYQSTPKAAAEMTDLLLGATKQFGLDGSKSLELMSKHANDMIMMDDKQRDEFANRLLSSAGKLAKAGVNLEKYTADLRGSEGADAMQQAAALGSANGMSMEQVLVIMGRMKDGDAGAETDMINMQKKALNDVGINIDELSKQAAAIKGASSADREDPKFLQMERDYRSKERLAEEVMKPGGVSGVYGTGGLKEMMAASAEANRAGKEKGGPIKMGTEAERKADKEAIIDGNKTAKDMEEQLKAKAASLAHDTLAKTEDILRATEAWTTKLIEAKNALGDLVSVFVAIKAIGLAKGAGSLAKGAGSLAKGAGSMAFRLGQAVIPGVGGAVLAGAAVGAALGTAIDKLVIKKFDLNVGWGNNKKAKEMEVGADAQHAVEEMKRRAEAAGQDSPERAERKRLTAEELARNLRADPVALEKRRAELENLKADIANKREQKDLNAHAKANLDKEGENITRQLDALKTDQEKEKDREAQHKQGVDVERDNTEKAWRALQTDRDIKDMMQALESMANKSPEEEKLLKQFKEEDSRRVTENANTKSDADMQRYRAGADAEEQMRQKRANAGPMHSIEISPSLNKGVPEVSKDSEKSQEVHKNQRPSTPIDARKVPSLAAQPPTIISHDKDAAGQRDEQIDLFKEMNTKLAEQYEVSMRAAMYRYT